MSSRQEEEEAAGPSGLDHHEVLQLLGLNTSDSENEETAANSSHEPLLRTEEMADSDEDDLCQEALDRFERHEPFKPTSFNKVGEVWMPVPRAPSSLS